MITDKKTDAAFKPLAVAVFTPSLVAALVDKMPVAEPDDICGLCGQPGADKYAHPMHWPGEQVPDGPLVHAECENAACQRAHACLTQPERDRFLRSITR